MSNSSAIQSIEKTPGTQRSGKWVVITTNTLRAQAEVDVDNAIKQAKSQTQVANKFGYEPRRINQSIIDVGYVQAISANNRDTWHTKPDEVSIATATTMSTLSSLESKLDRLEGKYSSKTDTIETAIQNIQKKSRHRINLRKLRTRQIKMN